ncbi:Mur ligase domain-containing protein [Reichenbachiella sp. MALMAid0571]|uniref:UDP-N-acetylmuramate--L-alanine ligase n=1 Tax=Reichenbachiella sp. MALMAid0571 TaxID=3143939 RepID=UPI0032DF722A
MNQNIEKVHFIAIGGSVMSNLAIALHNNGIKVSGSDDKVYDPAKSALEATGLLPASLGWYENNIDDSLDAVILGMHAKADNPELLKAEELGIKVYSYPDFIYEQSKNKQRVVICGSHGKTTITAMIVHVLKYHNREFDYLIGARINGIEQTIQLSDAPLIIIEGDEYLTSPIDRVPKFLKYQHHIALVSGIAWDHINVYPTLDSYVEQFELLADATPKAGTLVYNEEDDMTSVICKKERFDVKTEPYCTPKYKIKNGQFIIKNDDEKVALKIFGKHNMQNLNGAKTLLGRIGITDEQFYEAIGSFEGTQKRNNLLAKNNSVSVYEDFAHAPSKLKATVNALKELHPERKLTACFELHTFSSLNKAFLKHYKNTYNSPETAIVFINKKNLSQKELPEISEEEVRKTFHRNDILVIDEAEKLSSLLSNKSWKDEDLIFMSSGNFDGLDIKKLAHKITA